MYMGKPCLAHATRHSPLAARTVGANLVLIQMAGTSLRELVHKFRFRTLMLLKLLMLQRKVSR